jgi:hypothetical protein
MLVPGNSKGALKTRLGFSMVLCRQLQQQLALVAMQLGFASACTILLNQQQGFCQRRERRGRLPVVLIGSSQEVEKIRLVKLHL